MYHPDAPTGDQDKFVIIKNAFEEIEAYYKATDVDLIHKQKIQ